MAEKWSKPYLRTVEAIDWVEDIEATVLSSNRLVLKDGRIRIQETVKTVTNRYQQRSLSCGHQVPQWQLRGKEAASSVGDSLVCFDCIHEFEEAKNASNP